MCSCHSRPPQACISCLPLPTSPPNCSSQPPCRCPQIDTQIFSHLVRQEFPVVARHLEAMGAEVSCVVVQWLVCLFVNFLPLETCLRVWDILFYHRWAAFK